MAQIQTFEDVEKLCKSEHPDGIPITASAWAALMGIEPNGASAAVVANGTANH